MEGVQPRRVLSSAFLGCVQHVTPGEGGPQAKLTAEPCSTLDHRTATCDLDWTRILKKSPAVKNVAVCSPSGRAARLQSVASRWPPCPRSSVPGRVWSRTVQRDLAPAGLGSTRGSNRQFSPRAARGRQAAWLLPAPSPTASRLLSPRRRLTNITHPSLRLQVCSWEPGLPPQPSRTVSGNRGPSMLPKQLPMSRTQAQTPTSGDRCTETCKYRVPSHEPR